MFAIADKNTFEFPSYEHTGHIQIDSTGAQTHIDAIMALPYIDVEKIRKKKYRVVLDSVNGTLERYVG